MNIDQAADQLYALAPGDFVEARDALVRQARESGDRELAGAIATLRKPTAVAWLANRLARERPRSSRTFLPSVGLSARPARRCADRPFVTSRGSDNSSCRHSCGKLARSSPASQVPA